MKAITRLLITALLLTSVWLHAADDAATRFNFATGLLIKNEFALAADEFEALLKQHPDFAQADVARYRLGEARQQAGDKVAAREAFAQLLHDFPKSERAPQAHYWLAQFLAPEQPAEAASHYAAIVTEWPDNQLAEAAAYGVAETRFKANDWPAAIAACDQLLKQFPASKQAPNALYTRGWAAFQAGNWELARASFDALNTQFPDNGFKREAQLKIAQALHKLDRNDEALALYTALAQPGDAIGLDATIARASILFARDDKPAAATAFETAAKQLDGDLRQPACWLNAGHAWFAASEYAKAAAAFTQLTTKHPQDALAPTATYWLGQAQLRAGDPVASIATLTPLLDVAAIQESLGFELRMLLAEAHSKNKDPARAAAAYGFACQFKPDHPRAPDALIAQMAAWELAGDAAAAEKTALAFIAAYPKHERADDMRFWVGEFRFRQQRQAEAATAFAEFLKAAPKHALVPDALYKLGWCARTAQHHAEARQHFAALADGYPKHALAAEAAFRCGESAEALGDAAAAEAAYAQSVTLAPEGDFAAQATLAQIAIQLSRREAVAALERADAFIKGHPQSPLLNFAHLYRAEALSQLERFEEALTAYRLPAVNQEGTATDAAFGAAWCLRQLKRHAEAAAAFEAVAAAGGVRAAEAAFLAARAREEAKEFTKAREAYATITHDEKQSEVRRDEAAYREASCAWQAQDAAGALTLFAAIAARQPASAFAPQALYDQAWILQEQNKTADAEARFRDLIARFPKHDLAPDVQFRLGEIAYGRGDFAGAAAAYEAALQIPDIAFADEVRYKLGWTYEQLKRPEEALTTFAKLVEAKPDSERVPEARYRQGRLLHELGRHDAAVTVLAAVTEGPFAERATLLKAEALRAANQQREALVAYDHLLKTWPEGACRIAAQLGRGHSLRAVGANQDALEAYAAVIAATQQEEAAMATLGQGYCYFAMQNWAEAAKAFLKVDILYGYDALKKEALEQLALTWEKAGDAERAARYRNERAQRYPETP